MLVGVVQAVRVLVVFVLLILIVVAFWLPISEYSQTETEAKIIVSATNAASRTVRASCRD